MQKCTADGQEVRVTGVVYLNNAPGVLSGSNTTSTELKHILRADNRKWHQASELGILFDSVFVIFFNVVGEIVDRDAVVLNIFHDQFLGLGQFCGGQGIRLANDWDHIDTWRQSLHQFNVKFSETVACGGDKVEECMHAIVAESGVTLDTRFFGKDVIVLSLQVTDNLAE